MATRTNMPEGGLVREIVGFRRILETHVQGCIFFLKPWLLSSAGGLDGQRKEALLSHICSSSHGCCWKPASPASIGPDK